MAQELEGLSAVILAGGKGTRMKSRLPKVLHPVLGEPMIFHSLRAVEHAGIPPERTIVVVGHEAEAVRKAIEARGPYRFAEQPEPLGTGHALMVADSVLQTLAQDLTGGLKNILVLYGDNVLLRPQTLASLINLHLKASPLVTLASAETPDPSGYGRVIRQPETGRFQAIVEQVDLLPEQVSIKEFNAGVYVFQADWALASLPRLKKSPKGEYYLTDLPGFAIEDQPDSVETVLVDAEDVLGINDRVQLAEVSAILRQRILRRWMLAGVTVTDPSSTYISAESIIGPDTVIEPNTHLKGACKIGSDCVIGPNSILSNIQTGDRVNVLASVLEDSVLEDEVAIGPFSRVRPGCYLEKDVRMGNFAEVSRSRVGTGTRQGHFSFLGDATVGPNVNVGAGTITANYDGVNKNKTIIGSHVFLGCDTILRAPVSVGDEAKTGAGSVVTKDVQAGTTVVGIPARLIKRKKAEETTGTGEGTSAG
ncbi:MAG TPA: bifunctional UDP-N-acetylglucosamine diphosphorylase/glucosamine-1-phosphate N-acetyltransferase GlmU [Chloroflexia bacterium]|nr:bifunctional UDP-N-acetylglucosamine diphosphorylase/glucosamine-1-phosphate N-acetyltransferase GlmU [Chloroflexia bacterium]